MNTKELKEILELMTEHELSEIVIEKEGLKLKVRKNAEGQFVPEHFRGAHPVAMPLPAMPATPDAAAPAAVPQAPQEDPGVVTIHAPMVGTFYAAPAPDQPSYVAVGKTIGEGDVLCILEAMKLMNEIKSDISGTISEILVQNGQPVEFDQPLFKIKKA